MVDDKEIYQSAQALIARYGDEAGLHAAQRADELLDAGDVAGERVWLRIIEAIRILKSDKPEGSVH